SLMAIAKIVIKDREALAAIGPYQKTMLLTTLYWPDEIRATDELDLPEEAQTFKPAELEMARNLVSAMTTEFNPAEYHDEYREALMALIEAKIEGREVAHVEAPEEPTGRLVDLMAVLEASVAAAKQGKTAAAEPAAEAAGGRARKGTKAAAKRVAAEPAPAAAKAERKARGRRRDEQEAEAPARRRKSA
ncbi:MAG TPA: Ku protein, partial [Candidatus Limnocylindrales bacterium]|nr:Ku protein [Candidatus Limnocylindrales bacterium]